MDASVWALDDLVLIMNFKASKEKLLALLKLRASKSLTSVSLVQWY
jgi:hypothetical protein